MTSGNSGWSTCGTCGALFNDFSDSSFNKRTECSQCVKLKQDIKTLMRSPSDTVETVGKKNDAEKPPIHMIPAEFIEQVALAFAFGANKYGENNFRQGIKCSRLISAALRHLLAILRGEWLDPESGLPHWAHAGASIAMLAYMTLNKKEFNDLYELNKNKEAVCAENN